MVVFYPRPQPGVKHQILRLRLYAVGFLFIGEDYFIRYP